MSQLERDVRARAVAEIARAPDLLPFAFEAAPLSSALPALRRRYPALTGALYTIPFTAPVQSNGVRVLHEWNPLAQRLYVPPATERSPRALPDLADLKRSVLRFVELGHELCHILLWEPFFTGRVNPLESMQGFADYAFLTEAFAFWYADTLLLEDLARALLREPALLHGSVGFQGMLCPREVLADRGFRTPLRQLEVYLGVLALDRDWKLAPGEEARFRYFCTRLWGFRSSNEQSVERWYRLLLDSGIRDDFFTRFCPRGAPSFMSDAPAGTAEEDIREFLVRLGRETHADLPSAPRVELRRIRLRRELQARAYFLLQLRHAIDRGLVETRAATSTGAAARALIAAMLDAIEGGLASVVRRQSAPALKVLREVDARFERFAATMRRADAFIARRELLAPDDHLSQLGTASIGLRRCGVHFSATEAASVPRSLPPHFPALVSDPPEAARTMRWAREAKSRVRAEREAGLDRYLAAPSVRHHWTVELGALSFKNNRLREPLFEIA